MSKNLNPSDVNILIVGETGVGKSTFVNAFANYVNFPSLEEAAAAEEIISVIPSKFSIMDENFVTKDIKFGEDKNECDVPGSSATIDTRMYRIPFDDCSIILIDTPGVGDTRGIEYDETNLQNLLAEIAELKHLHAIMILLKPNDSRVNVLFQYCIKHLLSSLEKSASSNIVFLFTHSRGTFYRPGDTVAPLRTVLKEIQDKPPYVSVPFNKTNSFCVDNEAFRFLIARKNNITFTEDETKEFAESWNRSANESRKMLNYIIGLKPHNIQSTVSVNTSRMLIFRMSKPLADISQNITDNIDRMKHHQKMHESRSLSIKELREKLVVKRIGLKINTIEKPMTVCCHEDCVSHYNVDDCSTVNYSQICHDSCEVSGVPKEVLGSIRLLRCKAINFVGVCKRERCGHNFRQHMHIYYESEPYEYDAEDASVSKDIRTNEDAQTDINRKMEKIKACIEEYEYEQDVIQDSMAKFAHFLKYNAITPINDAYKDYIQYYMNLEKKKDNSDTDKIQYFEQLMKEYDERVHLLEVKLKEEREQNDSTSAVSSEDIAELKNILFKLPLYGKTIKEAIEAQQSTARNNTPITDVKKIRYEKGKVRKAKEWLGSVIYGYSRLLKK